MLFCCFAAIKAILGVIIPRMKDFHDLLARPPNVSLLHITLYVVDHMTINICVL